MINKRQGCIADCHDQQTPIPGQEGGMVVKPRDDYQEQIKVQVTKRLPKKEIRSIVRQFIDQKITFAVSRHDSEYEVWREVFPDDEPRVKNRKDGMTPTGVIAQDQKDLEQRNFICIWEKGTIVYGNMDKF